MSRVTKKMPAGEIYEKNDYHFTPKKQKKNE